MKPFSRFAAIRNWPRTMLTALVVVLLASVLAAFQQGQHIARERLEASFDRSSISRLNLLQRELHSPFLVPEVLTASKTVRALLAQPNPTAANEQSRILEETALNTHVDVIYVMDLNGNCLAASNWQAPDSFVGKNYQFRPYFQQALAGHSGRYVAKGVTSAKLGYYLARPVTLDGKINGVVVAKISFDALSAHLKAIWHQDEELNLVADKNGVVFVSPLDAFILKSMTPMAATQRKTIESSRQFDDVLQPVAITPGKLLAEGLRFVEFAELPGASFLQKSYAFPDLELGLFLHVPASHYWKIVAQFTAMLTLLALVVFLACISLYQRWVYSAKLIETAIRDPLTGLHTRLYMGDWCQAAIQTHNRVPSAAFGLVVFDLDWFKQVNDKFGHLAGDDVLRRVGQLIRNAIRGQDLAVRFGGEEIAVFVQGADLAETLALAERIRQSVGQFMFQSKGQVIPVTLSGGVAIHTVGESLDALFSRADEKLYEAKERGRNQIRS
ncbi:MAG: diguanylate cyclase [Rhodoferax sp.]|uniref:sensor domain-containing diguanylate cyclase n=1 Tax=Rhodoferax sp. TaxID=50421 RepID=UPI0027334510|nr:sensor domain-containing diguanylate cyclase [Rhodoferax sp.]MDP2680321.1 diguanylate cyclase [Rhodoferax sp.]